MLGGHLFSGQLRLCGRIIAQKHQANCKIRQPEYEHDPAFTGLFDNPQWKLPQRLPDGNYTGGDVEIFSNGFELGKTDAWADRPPRPPS